MADWRVAKSLNVLLAQLNELAPNRSRASDGSIGDPDHSSRTSDHNPDEFGIVRARDFTNDPAGGLDCRWLANQLAAWHDPRLKYVIWAGQIYSYRNGFWAWREYTGPNAHAHHLHLSVVPSTIADFPGTWKLGEAPSPPANRKDDDMSVIFAKGDKAALTCKVEFDTGEWGGIAYRTVVPNPQEPGYVLWTQRYGPPEVIPQDRFDAIPYKPGTPGAKE